MAEKKIYSVSEFVRALNNALEQLDCSIVGEVTEVNKHRSGHVYFVVKDRKDEAVINCAIWKGKYIVNNIEIKIGDELVLHGKPNYYAPYGKLSFIVDKIEYEGEGSLKKKFEELKKKLSQKGYFDVERKRELPVFPEAIGLMTAPGSRAYSDVMKTINERWSGITIKFYPIQVQGVGSTESIMEAFTYFNEHKGVDVLILTRGGGSLEDLATFNSEDVASIIFSSKIPVICGIGHEADESLAEYVADKRASTPTNAGEIVAPDKKEIGFRISRMATGITGAVTTALEQEHNEMVSLLARAQSRVEEKIESAYMRINTTIASIATRIEGRVERGMLLINARVSMLLQSYDHARTVAHDQLSSHVRLLKNIDPRTLLKKGYALQWNAEGGLITSVKDVTVGETMRTQLSDGDLESTITKT